MSIVWKAVLAALALALVGLLAWLLFPLFSSEVVEGAALGGSSRDYFDIEGAVPGSSVLLSDMNPNVHVGNNGLIFQLDSKTPSASATVDFTDRSGLLDPFFTRSAIGFELRACGGEDEPAGNVRIEVRTDDGDKPMLFVLNKASPRTDPGAVRYLWKPVRITVTWEAGSLPARPDCAALVARIDTPRALETAPSR